MRTISKLLLLAAIVFAATIAFTVSSGTAHAASVCPAVGADTDCGVIVTVTDTGATVVATGQGPYDGIEDTLIGVVNNSSQPLSSMGLQSALQIFLFDGDGIDTFGISGNAMDNSGYGGPNAFYTNIDPSLTTGTVNFITPVAAGGGTAYFSLEEAISGVTVTTVNGNPPGLLPSTIAYTGPTVIANTLPVTLSAKLTTGTTPISGETVTLTLGTGGTAQSCTGTTDATGAASCSLTVSQPLGPGTVTASFAGDSTYASSSATANTIIFVYTSGGTLSTEPPKEHPSA